MIKHVKRRGHEKVTPTPRMLRYWWGRLNAALFDNELLPCRISYGKPKEGWCVCGVFYPDSQSNRGAILIDPRVDTRYLMLATLAHEMVHQLQWQRGGKLNHGPSFERWRKPIKKATGLDI